MIGLVLGDSQLGRLIIKKLKFLGKKYIIIDISKKKIFRNEKNSFSLSIGQLGKAISILKENRCKKVIFAGRVSRPNFSKTKFDFKALYHLPKIIKGSLKGDAYIIKVITKIFKKEGLRIINQTSFNPEFLLKKGNYTKVRPDVISKKDILIGKSIIKDLNNNVGQAAVIRNGNVVVVEDSNGTDFMLRRAKKILNKLPQQNKRKGVLIKFPKPNQDLRIDLPTIGTKTIKKCAKLQIKGIVLKSNQNIFIDKLKCISIANKNKMFIYIV